jgi:UDP-GlcNAc:undecaprenyl-phosphate GlcNAc-1-phosphate transferase
MRDSLHSLIYILAFFSGAFVISLLINSFFLKFARTLGIRNKNDVSIRWSATSKPSLGGISFYFTFLIGFMFYAIIFGETDVFQNKSLLGLFFSVTLAFLLGLSDDAYNTKPYLKLLIQVTCGIILCYTDSSIELFNNDSLNATLTVLWVVGIMNSINMLDNMDGITTITSIGIITTLIAISIPFVMHNQVEIFLLITALGTLSAFLIFNYNPAKMFMGDTGSQFLGMFLAYFSIKLLWNNGIELGDFSVFTNLTLVLTVFAIPLIDTTIVSINRIIRGQSPMVGGKDHTTHHLVYKGFTERQVAITFIMLGVASVLLAFVLKKYVPKESLFIFVIWLYIFLVFILFFVLSRRQKEMTDVTKLNKSNDN